MAHPRCYVRPCEWGGAGQRPEVMLSFCRRLQATGRKSWSHTEMGRHVICVYGETDRELRLLSSLTNYTNAASSNPSVTLLGTCPASPVVAVPFDALCLARGK